MIFAFLLIECYIFRNGGLRGGRSCFRERRKKRRDVLGAERDVPQRNAEDGRLYRSC